MPKVTPIFCLAFLLTILVSFGALVIIGSSSQQDFQDDTQSGRKQHETPLPLSDSLPEELDWSGRLVDVGDQGKCSSCWAFSPVHAVSAHLAIHKNRKLDLSVQQLIDCATYDGTNNGKRVGCDTYSVEGGFRYIRDKGLQTAADYPYVGNANGRCSYDPNNVKVKIDNFSLSYEKDEEGIKWMVAKQGPVVSTVNIRYLKKHYRGGIYTNSKCPADEIDHAVLIVGYGQNGSQKYWIVKNSFGTDWGESGYFRILRGEGLCGIGEAVFYPTGVILLEPLRDDEVKTGKFLPITMLVCAVIGILVIWKRKWSKYHDRYRVY